MLAYWKEGLSKDHRTLVMEKALELTKSTFFILQIKEDWSTMSCSLMMAGSGQEFSFTDSYSNALLLNQPVVASANICKAVTEARPRGKKLHCMNSL